MKQLVFLQRHAELSQKTAAFEQANGILYAVNNAYGRDIAALQAEVDRYGQLLRAMQGEQRRQAAEFQHAGRLLDCFSLKSTLSSQCIAHSVAGATPSPRAPSQAALPPSPTRLPPPRFEMASCHPACRTAEPSPPPKAINPFVKDPLAVAKWRPVETLLSDEAIPLELLPDVAEWADLTRPLASRHPKKDEQRFRCDMFDRFHGRAA